MRILVILVCLLYGAVAHAAGGEKAEFLRRIERVSATTAEAAKRYDRAFHRKCGYELTKEQLHDRLRIRGGDPAFDLIRRGAYSRHLRTKGEADIACSFRPVV